VSRRATAFLLLVAAGILAGAASGGPAAAPPAPDLLFFRDRLFPELQLRCGGCHQDRETAGGWYIAPEPGGDPAVAAFRASLRFLDPERPEESPLLRKSLGQETHGGGATYASRAAKDFEPWLDFALGATSGNRPPDAVLPKRMQGVPGDPIEIDGTLSGDRDGDRLSYEWTITKAPVGSKASLDGEGTAAVSLRADLPGEYRVSLRVSDGRLRSAPFETTVSVAGGAPSSPARPSASPGEPTRTLEARPNADRLRMVRRLYMDLLWRSPTLEEIARDYPKTQDRLVDDLLATEEAWSAWYEAQLYYFLLLNEFRPKEGPIPGIPARIAKGEISVPRALEEIVRSQYFGARNPGNDTFCTVVLEQCLGMTVQEARNKPILEAGKKMYDGYRTRLWKENGDSQADFVRIVFSQPAFFDHLLTRTYEALHGRPIEKKRLEQDRARLAADANAFRAILGDWLKGPGYLAAVREPRTKPEVPYVRSLFLDTLGRMPTYDELRNVRNAFLSMADPTPVRLVMGRVLLESSTVAPPGAALEPERFVTDQFLRLLARPPTPTELEAFASALRNDPNTTPRLVVWTLLSSAEYQTY